MTTQIRKSNKENGFSLAEVLVALLISAVFGAAVFATNQRLLFALKSQRETTAASMMLQERVETFRGFGYSNLANKDYVNNNVVKVATTSEALLNNLSETINVVGYLTSAGAAGDGTALNSWTRNTAHPSGQENSHYDTLATDFDLLKVDIVISWTSANGRSRTRELQTIVGKGNVSG